MMKHFLLCLRGSQGVTIAFFDCIGRCVGTAPPTPRFAASTCGWRTLVLGCFRRSGWPLRFGLPLGGWPSGSLLPLFGMQRFGDCPRRAGSSAFRFGDCPRRVGLRTHCFRFSARAASEIALGGLVLPLGELAFGFTASAFRHAPFRSGRWASSFFRLPLRKLPLAGWPSGSLLPLFGMHRFAPPRRRSEDRRSTPTRHLFHFKTLIPTC